MVEPRFLRTLGDLKMRTTFAGSKHLKELLLEMATVALQTGQEQMHTKRNLSKSDIKYLETYGYYLVFNQDELKYTIYWGANYQGK